MVDNFRYVNYIASGSLHGDCVRTISILHEFLRCETSSTVLRQKWCQVEVFAPEKCSTVTIVSVFPT